MAQYQKQHHVPQFVLERFKDIGRRAYYLRKAKPNKIIPLTSVSSTFQKTFQYSIIKEDGTRDHATEKHWSVVEAAAKKSL